MFLFVHFWNCIKRTLIQLITLSKTSVKGFIENFADQATQKNYVFFQENIEVLCFNRIVR